MNGTVVLVNDVVKQNMKSKTVFAPSVGTKPIAGGNVVARIVFLRRRLKATVIMQTKNLISATLLESCECTQIALAVWSCLYVKIVVR